MSLLRRWQETNWYSTLGTKVAVALLATAAAVLLNGSTSFAQTPTFTLTSTPTATITPTPTQTSIGAQATATALAATQTALALPGTQTAVALTQTALVPTNTPTRTLTPTATTIPATATANAIATANALINAAATPVQTPQSTTPCAPLANQTCTSSSSLPNGPTGTATNNGNGTFRFNITATSPSGTIAGTTPSIFITTTAGEESSLNSGFTCTAVAGASIQTTCTGTTRGSIFQGTGVIIRFATAGAPGFTDLPGSIFGPGLAGGVPGAVVPVAPPVSIAGNGLPFAVPQVGIPAVPRPPVQFIPSAPPPLLPPTGQLGALQQGVAGAPMAPPRYPEVPVIPETDSLALVLGGLAAIGAVALYRRRRQ